MVQEDLAPSHHRRLLVRPHELHDVLPSGSRLLAGLQRGELQVAVAIRAAGDAGHHLGVLGRLAGLRENVVHLFACGLLAVDGQHRPPAAVPALQILAPALHQAQLVHLQVIAHVHELAEPGCRAVDLLMDQRHRKQRRLLLGPRGPAAQREGAVAFLLEAQQLPRLQRPQTDRLARDEELLDVGIRGFQHKLLVRQVVRQLAHDLVALGGQMPCGAADGDEAPRLQGAPRALLRLAEVIALQRQHGLLDVVDHSGAQEGGVPIAAGQACFPCGAKAFRAGELGVMLQDLGHDPHGLRVRDVGLEDAVLQRVLHVVELILAPHLRRTIHQASHAQGRPDEHHQHQHQHGAHREARHDEAVVLEVAPHRLEVPVEPLPSHRHHARQLQEPNGVVDDGRHRDH
mmetsp:Transcript_39565/g.94478  ORF Transcript_39565/g.94478 Transcript_39565/m.94478 type:complete len:401 (-) Transcript_39565:1023-2225(-)